ncbi:MAG: hypothetical protein AB7G28_14055 [Pirellulales bacterium]
MNTFTKDNLRQLAGMNGEYVASIYFPATTGAEQRQNPIHFKSLIRAAGQQMQARGIREPAIQKMTVSAHTLLDRPELWRELAHGLAVFVSRDALHAFALPFHCDEICVVGKCAYLLPLLAWDSHDTSYFVLAVSRNAVRLLQGSRARLDEVAVPMLPADLATALRYEVRQGTLQMHSGQPQIGGKEGVVFHGQGGEVDVSKDELTEYFRRIDRAVSDYLQLRREPLVFAGVDYLFPMYQSGNHYTHLVLRSVEGNPDQLAPADLCTRAWTLVEGQLREREEASAEQHWNSVGSGRTANRIVEILAAAQAGAIETLYVEAGARRMGRYLPESATVRYDGAPQADSEELVNQAAVLVLRSGGAVVAMEPNRVPDGGVIAAVLRYAHTPVAVPPISTHNASAVN